MLVALGAEHHAPVFENANQRLIGVLEEQALDGLDVIDEMTVETNAVHDRKAVGLTECEVIDTVGRRRMDDARAIFGAHKFSRHHSERVLRVDVDVVEQLFVTHTDELRAFYRLDDLVLDIAEYGFAQGLGDN